MLICNPNSLHRLEFKNMTSKIKLYLLRKITEAVHHNNGINVVSLKPLLIYGNGRDESRFLMSMELKLIENLIGVTNVHKLTKIQPDDVIKHVEILRDRANRKVSFVIHHDIFVKEVLENCTLPDQLTKPQSIVVEYSSPNIAKPFHVGHLRSTIIGNFVSNIHAFLKHKVTRLNYLGDWGTQFGFIKVGVDELNHNLETIKKDPIKTLYESYVHANKLAERNPEISQRAREEFRKLENGSVVDLQFWNEFMGHTKKELSEIYQRLGVQFDEYYFESMYNSKASKSIIEDLQKRHVLQKDKDGKEIVIINKRKVSLLKSDGTTLYLTRDVAAAIDRYNKYKFDRMYYVVENGQNDHFNTLRNVLYLMDVPWADRLKHIKFGRIHGMSTRKGKVVFLKDILDECRDLMMQRQLESPTTKVSVKDSSTSDILGISCVIINDLKQRRQKDYKFSWDNVLQVQGDGGIKLQYTHCRLVNIMKNADVPPARVCLPELLAEPEVTSLISHLAKFPEILNSAEEQLEACILVTYLFHLCNYTNKAIKHLKVKGSPPDIAAQRLLLFETCRKVLHTGMVILGLKPLNEM